MGAPPCGCAPRNNFSAEGDGDAHGAQRKAGVSSVRPARVQRASLLGPATFGMHSLRRTKAVLISRRHWGSYAWEPSISDRLEKHRLSRRQRPQSPRGERASERDLSTWTVTDDWPEKVPVTEEEAAVFESWFGDLFDELFGPETLTETAKRSPAIKMTRILDAFEVHREHSLAPSSEPTSPAASGCRTGLQQAPSSQSYDFTEYM